MGKRRRKHPPVPGSIEDIVRKMTAAGMQYGAYMQYQYTAKCRADREKERAGNREKDA